MRRHRDVRCAALRGCVCDLLALVAQAGGFPACPGMQAWHFRKFWQQNLEHSTLKKLEKARFTLAKLTWGHLHLSFPLSMALHFHILCSGQNLYCPLHALVGNRTMDGLPLRYESPFLTVSQLGKTAEVISIRVVS